jgi:hypothetical protein
MRCWRHPHLSSPLSVDLLELLTYYQDHYAGAMYSGCGGGYLFVVSDEPVPGATHAKIRVAQNVGQP